MFLADLRVKEKETKTAKRKDKEGDKVLNVRGETERAAFEPLMEHRACINISQPLLITSSLTFHRTKGRYVCMQESPHRPSLKQPLGYQLILHSH